MTGKQMFLTGSVIAGIISNQASSATLNYFQTNLVSDLPGVARNTDANLVNPWGIAFSGTSPFWIADNHTGVSTLYNGAGQPFPVGSPLVVTIPPPIGSTATAAPTGVIFNGSSDFGNSRFIFATEDGTISAWSSGTAASLKVDNSPFGAVYKGLATASSGAANFLYAANFNAGTVDVFNSSFAQVSVPGGFQDPNIPSGFAPFNIQNIGGQLYVTYAKQDADKHDDVAGAGNGFVDIFDGNGNLIRRLISDGALNSPWGITLAPASFGAFSNDLLVGNFGDGIIDAYDPTSGNLLGQLLDAQGNPVAIPGLWALAFGNGGPGFDRNTLYITAGIPGPDDIEDHGLFAQIQTIPEPSTLGLAVMGLACARLKTRRSRR